jgi:Uncharacterized protein conserved in bacteria (DUF2188)
MQRDRFFVDAAGGGRWILIRKGQEQPVRSFRTKREAVKFGRDTARSRGYSQLVVKGRNHDIQTEWTYGKDPRRHPG